MTRNRLYSLVLILGIAGFFWTIISYVAARHGLSTPVICLFRKVTGIPCPSCGTVHSIFMIMKGEFLQALYENPLGYAGVMMIVVMPVWITIDLILRKNTFYRFFLGTEKLLKKRRFAIPLILMVIAIWIWKIITFFG